MKRYAIALLAWLLLAASASAQIIGGGIIGGGGDLIAKLGPTQQLESSSGVFTDAAIQFTAIDASRLAMGTNWNPGTKDFAISFWVYLDTSTATQTVLCTGAATNGQDGLCVQINSDGNVLFALNDSVQASRLTATFTAGIADTTWTHITIYADRSGNAVCYKNGVANAVTLDISTHNASLGATGGNVGSDLTPGNYLNGRLDSLLLFELADMSSVISAMVSALYASGEGVLATDLSSAQIAAWGGKYGYDLGEASGVRSSATGWTANDLTPTFAELLSNTGFETAGAGGTDVFANWLEVVSSTSTVNDETSVVHAGSHACRVDLNASNSYAGVAQGVLTVGKRYTVSAYAKISDASAPNNSFYFRFGGLVAGDPYVHTLTADYALYSTTAVAVATGGMYLMRGVAASKSVYFDTVSLKAAEILPAPGIVRGICVDDDDVSFWESLLATGDAQIETLAHRPLYDDTTEAWPIITSDGVDDRLTTVIVPGDAGCAVLVLKGGADGDVYVGASHGTEVFGITNKGGVIYASAGDSSPALTSTVDPTAAFHVVVFSHAGNGGAQFLMIDGVVKDTDTQVGTLSITETLYLFCENDDGTATDFAEASIARAYYFPQAISQSSAAGITKRIQNALGLSP